jgi:hypothetical protein
LNLFPTSIFVPNIAKSKDSNRQIAMNQNLEKLISAAYSDNKQTLEQLLILFPKDIGGFARKTCSISKTYKMLYK